MSYNLFSDFSINGDKIVNPKEGIRYEYKKSFNWKDKEMYAKIIASFANREGGYLIFGIEDDGSIIGLNSEEFEKKDSSEISKYLNSIFVPAIVWSKCICPYNNKKIGVIEIKESNEKPIISSKNEGRIKEGDIFYRYTAQTKKINYPELKLIIDKEKRKYGEELISGLKLIVDNGVENTKIFNINDFKKAVGNENKLYFINSNDSDLEGKFSETPKDSIPGGIVIKVVNAENGILVPVEKYKDITSETIIDSFLYQKLPENFDPKAFIEKLPYETSGLVPIYFFIEKASINKNEVIEIIKKAKSTTRGRETLLKRLTKKEYEFSYLTKSKFNIVNQSIISIINNEKFNEINEDQITPTLRYIRTISKNDLNSKWQIINSYMKYVYDNYYTDKNIRTEFRLAICYIDKELFG